jgi:hypothetical protein
LSDPARLGDIIARARGPSPRKKGDKLKLLALNWERIAGERTGRMSRPTRLARGTLTVTADGPAWAAEVSMQSARLMRASNEALGEGNVSRIRVRAGAEETGAERSEKDPEKERRRVEGAELGEETERQLETISQEDLRTSLERLLRVSATRKKQGRSEG